MFFVLYCRKVALRAPGRPSAAVSGIRSEVRSLQKIYIWLSRFPQFSKNRISGNPSKNKTPKKYTFRFSKNKTLFQNTKNSKIAGIPRLPKQNRYSLSIFYKQVQHKSTCIVVSFENKHIKKKQKNNYGNIG